MAPIRHHLKRHTKRVVIGMVGGLVFLIGVVMIPYPGPGWLVVFAGLAILSTEFAFAQRALEYLRGRYDRWLNWIKRQPRPIQVLFLLLTGAVVAVTVWLLNGPGFLNAFLHLNQDWLVSPFFR